VALLDARPVRGCSAVRVKADPDVDADQAATSAIDVQVADRHHAQDHTEDASGWSHSWAVPCRWIIGAVLRQDGALGAVATRAPSLLSIRRVPLCVKPASTPGEHKSQTAS